MPRVLVVDDERQVCDLARRAMSGLDLACDTAYDGHEAVERFNAGHYEGVVTDLRMPRRHGHELAVNLLSRPKAPAVVVMSALFEPRLVHDLMSRGVQDIFWKPFDYNVLALKMLSLVGRGSGNETANQPNQGGGTSSELMQIEHSLIEVTDLFAESLTGVFEFDHEISDPPKSVTNFITRFAKLEEEEADAHGNACHELRRTKRVACSEVVVALPVDRQFRPTGDPFKAAIRDVSEGGIHLLHTRATNAQYLALGWRAECVPYGLIRVVIKVTRCQARSPFYSISGQYVMAD